MDDDDDAKRLMGLGRDVQDTLGQVMRTANDPLGERFPSRFLELLGKLRGVEPAGSLPGMESGHAVIADSARDAQAFGPEQIATLAAAFDDAWATLARIGNTSITRAELAARIVELAAAGETSDVRLGAKALTGLIARG